MLGTTKGRKRWAEVFGAKGRGYLNSKRENRVEDGNVTQRARRVELGKVQTVIEETCKINNINYMDPTS